MTRFYFNLIIIFFIGSSLFFTNFSYGHVILAWDWDLITDESGNKVPKTTIIYCLENVGSTNGLPKGKNWKDSLDTAAETWNNADVGWKFKPSNDGKTDDDGNSIEGKVTEDCQLVLKIKEHNVGGGAGVSSSEKCDFTKDYPKKIKRLYLCVDPTPRSNVKGSAAPPIDWEDGEGFSPVLILTHELGHTLRLDHPPTPNTPAPPKEPGPHPFDLPQEYDPRWDKYEKDYRAWRKAVDTNLMDQINPGDIKRDLTKNDKTEAKDSFDREKTPVAEETKKTGSSGGNMKSQYPVFDSEGEDLIPDNQLSIPSGALDTESEISFRSLFYNTVPSRVDVPSGTCPILWAVEIESEISNLLKPATIIISYEDGYLSDPSFFDYKIPVQKEDSLKAYSLMENKQGVNWIVSESEIIVDDEKNTVTFEIDDFSPKYFGISGSCIDFPAFSRVLSPLKQISYGVKISDVTCNEELEIITKKSNDMPACVKPTTAEKLIERGWATVPN